MGLDLDAMKACLRMISLRLSLVRERGLHLRLKSNYTSQDRESTQLIPLKYLEMHQSLASGVQIGVILHWMGRSYLGLDTTWHAHSPVKRARDSRWVKWYSTSHTRRNKNINQVLAITVPTNRQSSTKILLGKLARKCARTSSLRSAKAFRLRQVSMIQTIPRSRTKPLGGG